MILCCWFVAELIDIDPQLLQHAEFNIKKEAAWAICNATVGGTPAQIRTLVAQRCMRPLCDLLETSDIKILSVALQGLERILKVGEQDAKVAGTGVNVMVDFVDEAEGLAKIENLQQHANHGALMTDVPPLSPLPLS